MRDISTMEKEKMSDGAKYRAQKEKARLRQAVKRAKRKEAGEVLVQCWTDEQFVQRAHEAGLKAVVVFARADDNLPHELYFAGRREVSTGNDGSTATGYIFRPW